MLDLAIVKGKRGKIFHTFDCNDLASKVTSCHFYSTGNYTQISEGITV